MEVIGTPDFDYLDGFNWEGTCWGDNISRLTWEHPWKSWRRWLGRRRLPYCVDHVLLLGNLNCVALQFVTMAERSSHRNDQSGLSKIQKRPSSTSKTVRPKAKPASAPAKLTDALWAQEEQYKLVNAKLDAKTSYLVREAEQFMREQNEALSTPLPNALLSDIKDNSRTAKDQPNTVQDPGVKVTSTAQSLDTRKQQKKPHCKTATSNELPDVDADGAADLFLARTIQSMEEKMNRADECENVHDEHTSEEDMGPGILDVQTRVLKAKLRILQEELDQLSHEYYKKDDENAKLLAKIKELEGDRARLQKTTSMQQTQIQKHKALAEDSSKKCDGLQLQVSAMNKEIEKMNRSQNNADVHSTVLVRLNRALEDVAKLKTELKNTKQTAKDQISKEIESKESVLAENKMLKKQKAELIAGFKKQMKLINILKSVKMHSEAANQLSLTEEEFICALDLEKS